MSYLDILICSATDPEKSGYKNVPYK